MTETQVARKITIAGRVFELRARDVRRAVRRMAPEPIASHFVVIDRRRFPPKQVICAVTGLDRADFTTHQARRILMRLGFAAGRRPTGSTGGKSQEARDRPSNLAERLRPFSGRWVAIKDDDVLYDADTPQQLVAWLSEHGQKAESVFRVPEDELAATGLAPQ
jgi:hypothetical protein